MTQESCTAQGREHFMFSALAAGQVVTNDWCMTCGYVGDSDKPHVVIKGQRRDVEDVESPDGLL